MIVMMLERVTRSLRGELSRWLLEPRTGVFVGTVSAVVRDKLWDLVCNKMGDGGGILVYDSNNEQGFTMRLWGNPDRTVVDFDGLSLVTISKKRA